MALFSGLLGARPHRRLPRLPRLGAVSGYET